jgi:maleate isomerase
MAHYASETKNAEAKRMTVFSYDLAKVEPTRIAVIVLQSDETIERDMIALRGEADLFFTRVPSSQKVTAKTLQSMADHITVSASLLPETLNFHAVGYGCTSGTAQIGISEIRRLVKAGVKSNEVSEPVSALIAACKQLNIKRLAFLSPYIEIVNANLRNVLADNGVQSPAFGTFSEAVEAKVVRISGKSVMEAAQKLCKLSDVDGIFLSCTNLRTLDLIEPLEVSTDLPVISSNLALAWHLGQLTGKADAMQGPGRLFKAQG